MDKMHLDELSLGAEAEVIGHPEVEGRNPHLPWKPQRQGNVAVNGVVAMETRRKVERRNEEERWRKLFPEIKKCVIVIARQSFDGLPKLKRAKDRTRREEERRGRLRSADPEPKPDWMQPVELDGGGEVGFTSFVKKVEVKMQPKPVHANGAKRPGLLRLSQSPDVTSHPADPAHHTVQSEDEMEHWRQIAQSGGGIGYSSQWETDHDYCLSVKEPDTPGTPNSQSLDARDPQPGESEEDTLSASEMRSLEDSLSPSCGHKDEDASSTEKKNPPSIIFKKVRGDRWVLRSQVKEEEAEEEEEEDSGVQTEQMELRRKENLPVYAPSPSRQKKRRSACGNCLACLRQDCGKCNFCRDKRKFGGPDRLKQRCRFRVCLMMETRNKTRQDQTYHTGYHTEETIEVVKEGQMWGGTGTTHRWMKREADKEEKEGYKPTNSVNQADKRRRWREKWRRRRRKWGQRRVVRESEDDSRTLTKGEEEEPKKEAQFLQFALVEGTGGLLPAGLLTGTHIQLNLTLDSSHFSPSILSDSTLTVNSQSGLLPQDGSVLRVSTGLPDVSPPPLLLQPKEEEEAVEITRGREESALREEETAGRTEDDELCSEGLTDGGRYYEMEVKLPDSDEEAPPPSPPSDSTEVPDDVAASDPARQPPEFIAPKSGSFRLFGDGGGGSGGNEVACEWRLLRRLLRLLQALRRTVLPAHWVPVLVGGPLLQLLQCSRLSSMADTVVHVQPDQSFYITVHDALLPDTHTLYRTHTQRIAHLSQLVSLLLDLEQLIVCRGSRVRSPVCQPRVRSPTCHLLVAPPCVTCLPCLLLDEEEEEEEEEEETEVEEDDDDDEGGDELSASL